MRSVPASVPTLDLHKFNREHINMAQIALELSELQNDLRTTHERLKDGKMTASSVALQRNILDLAVVPGTKSPVAPNLWK